KDKYPHHAFILCHLIAAIIYRMININAVDSYSRCRGDAAFQRYSEWKGGRIKFIVASITISEGTLQLSRHSSGDSDLFLPFGGAFIDFSCTIENGAVNFL